MLSIALFLAILGLFMAFISGYRPKEKNGQLPVFWAGLTLCILALIATLESLDFPEVVARSSIAFGLAFLVTFGGSALILLVLNSIAGWAQLLYTDRRKTVEDQAAEILLGVAGELLKDLKEKIEKTRQEVEGRPDRSEHLYDQNVVEESKEDLGLDLNTRQG